MPAQNNVIRCVTQNHSSKRDQQVESIVDSLSGDLQSKGLNLPAADREALKNRLLDEINATTIKACGGTTTGITSSNSLNLNPQDRRPSARTQDPGVKTSVADYPDTGID